MTNIKAQYFAVIFLTITLLSLITIRTFDNTSIKHKNLIEQLQKLIDYTHLLDEQTLKTRQGLLRNYDAVIDNMEIINQGVQQLQYPKSEVQQINNSSIEQLIKTEAVLARSVEQFLTNNAIVTNSITALPLLIDELRKHNSSNVHASERVLNTIFHYILWQKPETEKKIISILSTFDQKINNDNLIVTDILNLIKTHCNIILSNTQQVSKNLQAILNGQLTELLLQVQANTNENLNVTLKHNYYLDWIIYTIATLLLIFVFSLITVLRKSRREFVQETLFLNTLLDTISDGVVACNSQGKITLYNQAISKMHGIEDSSLAPEDWDKQCKLYDRKDVPIAKQAMPLYRALNDETIENQEFIIHPDNKNDLTKTISTHGAKIIDAHNNVLGAVISIQDISARQAVELKSQQVADEKRVISRLLELSYRPLDEFLQQSLLEIVSLEWLSILPKSGIFLTDDEGDSETLSLFCHYQLAPELLTLCAKVPFGHCLCGRAAEQKKIQFAHCIDHRHDTRFDGMKPHGHYNVPILEDKKVLGVMVFYLTHGHQQQPQEQAFLERAAYILSIGISRKYAEKKAQFLAYHDALTKLPNRLLLMDRLTQIIASGRRTNRFNALIYIDFDHFKHINDSLGHSVGDLLLKELSHRFKQVLREEDTVARLGGDEFVLLITDLSNNDEAATVELCRVIDKLQSSIANEFNLRGHRFYISMSGGIVILTGEDDDLDKLLMQADTAMYQAKADGRNTIQFFLPEMQEKALTRILLEKDLRHALEKQELSIYYQPQINAKDTLVGAEALLRWNHTKKGFISPVDFIPIAEETGLILEIGDFILRDACQNIINWKACTTLKHIAINVSPVQFRQQNYVETVIKILDETKADPTKLTLELTEGILVDNVEDIIAKMTALKQLGINFSVDDFGTGYSSLAYLKRFPLDQLKIDKSFVDDINVDDNGHVIIETIIAMAERLGFNLIAEGVETEEQLNYLKSNGCENFQGYYFSHPLTIDKFSEQYVQILSPSETSS